MSLTEVFQAIVVVFGLGFFALTQAARRRPDIAWLRPFVLPQLPAAQRERQRRFAERIAGIEMIVLGFALPPGYLILTMMTFSSVEPLWLAGTIAASVACIGAGIWVIVKHR